MKKYFFKTFLFYSVILIAQEDRQFQVVKSDLIKVSYIYSKPNADYKKEMTLLVDEERSQFHFLTDNETRKVDFYTAYIYFEDYYSSFFFNNFLTIEYRILESGKVLKSSWKNNFDWTITNDTKVISGLTVYKAYLKNDVTNKKLTSGFSEVRAGKVIAWFTKDIPIPSGPARYGGLPGLILELSYENFPEKYTFSGIEYNVTEKFYEPKNYYEVGKDTIFYPDKYNKVIKKLIKQ